jgi:carbonic anhydrase/acetyltransferase-like protein (isoleucine patch superfamily)
MPFRTTPLILPFGGIEPKFTTPPAAFEPGAAVLGRATIGARAKLRAFSVIRADGHTVTAGDDFTLGPRSTVHIAHLIHPAVIGDRVSVGENACVHGCTVGNDVVIADGVVILDGAVVEDNVLLEADSTVFPGRRLAGGHVYAGSPAKPVRPLAAGELQARREEIESRRDLAPVPDEPDRQETDASVFIASTAGIRGQFRAGQDASVWFSCSIDAGPGRVALGQNTNVQDNTIIRCETPQGVVIGPDTTVGHNVVLRDCIIGAGALIGIGSTVETGSVVRDAVLLAAGARTSPGQVLEGGFLWGGRPARKLARLDAAKLGLMTLTVSHYRQYARTFMAAEKSRPSTASEISQLDTRGAPRYE